MATLGPNVNCTKLPQWVTNKLSLCVTYAAFHSIQKVGIYTLTLRKVIEYENVTFPTSYLENSNRMPLDNALPTWTMECIWLEFRNIKVGTSHIQTLSHFE